MESRERDTNVIEAAGGLVWREGSHGKEIVIVHRSRYQDWALPKGKLNRGEAWEAAAEREVWEETGCKVRLDSFAGSVSYLVGDRPKVVLFWNMSLLGDCDFKRSDEVDQILWLSAAAALEKLQYATEISLLRNACGQSA